MASQVHTELTVAKCLLKFQTILIRFGLAVMVNLVANRRGQITSFLDDPEVPRLMIYMDGKDLAAVRHLSVFSIYVQSSFSLNFDCLSRL